MSGDELNTLLFPEHGAKTAFCDFWGKNRQYLNSKLKAKKPDEEMLRKYAEYKGYNADSFVKWARGPVTAIPYSDGKLNIFFHD